MNNNPINEHTFKISSSKKQQVTRNFLNFSIEESLVIASPFNTIAHLYIQHTITS